MEKLLIQKVKKKLYVQYTIHQVKCHTVYNMHRMNLKVYLKWVVLNFKDFKNVVLNNTLNI